MRVSVITVCFNAAESIERTIRSVLAQSYPDIEYIIVDGASTDGTLEIIKKYESKISKYISEKDHGIYDAMNKGIGIARGDVINFLNADDYYYDNDVVKEVVKEFESDPSRTLVYGKAELMNAPDNITVFGRFFINSLEDFQGNTICHQTAFASRLLFSNIGKFNQRYRYASDYEWLIKAYKYQPSGFYGMDRKLVYFSWLGRTNQYDVISRRESARIRVEHLFSMGNLWYYFRYSIIRGIKKKLLNEKW